MVQIQLSRLFHQLLLGMVRHHPLPGKVAVHVSSLKVPEALLERVTKNVAVFFGLHLDIGS